MLLKKILFITTMDLFFDQKSFLKSQKLNIVILNQRQLLTIILKNLFSTQFSDTISASATVVFGVF